MHQEIEGSGEPGVPGTCGKAQGNSGDTKCLSEAQELLGGWRMVWLLPAGEQGHVRKVPCGTEPAHLM